MPKPGKPHSCLGGPSRADPSLLKETGATISRIRMSAATSGVKLMSLHLCGATLTPIDGYCDHCGLDSFLKMLFPKEQFWGTDHTSL